MKIFLSFIFLVILTGCSCSKEEKTYSPSEMWSIAQKADPSIILVPITDPEKRILCENYPTDGCVIGSGKRILVSKVELISVQYETAQQARAAAFKLDQWYAGNWIFDDVTNEPVLESFVQKVFDAKRPASISE